MILSRKILKHDKYSVSCNEEGRFGFLCLDCRTMMPLALKHPLELADRHVNVNSLERVTFYLPGWYLDIWSSTFEVAGGIETNNEYLIMRDADGIRRLRDRMMETA